MVTIEDLNEAMRRTQKAMNENITRELYGDNTLLNYLEKHGRKPVKRSLGSEIARWRSRLGQLFLKTANSLGEYNDYE